MLEFRKAINRNTQCYEIRFYDVVLIISYETIIAARTPIGAFRLANTWGPTTGRHFKETYTQSFKVVDDAEFNHIVESALLAAVMTKCKKKLAPESACIA